MSPPAGGCHGAAGPKRLSPAGGAEPKSSLAAGWLGLAWRRLEVASAASIKRFYGQIWNLFYFEYILYLFI